MSVALHSIMLPFGPQNRQKVSFPLCMISSRLLLELYLNRKRDTVQPSMLWLINGEAEQMALDVRGAEVGMPAATCEVGCLGVRQGKDD